MKKKRERREFNYTSKNLKTRIPVRIEKQISSAGDTEDISDFPTDFVSVVLESSENVVGLEESKPIMKILEKISQLIEKRRKMKSNKKNIITEVEFS